MALGGGTFTSQNKTLTGAYINFVSAVRATASLGNRGIVTMPLELDWGVDGAVFEVTNGDLQKNALEIFGYDYTDAKLSLIRDVFKHATKLYAYKLTSGGVKATNAYADAKYTGIRGNDLTVVIATNVDDGNKFDVSLFLGTKLVDKQVVSLASELVDNAFVTWKKDAELANTAGVALSGGANGEVTGSSHSAYLSAIENYTFNTMGVVTDDETTKGLYVAFTKRMRDDVGVKFQCVLFNQSADYEGVVNVKNGKELVAWVTGLIGGCEINKSCTNALYDGEATVSTAYTQSQLESAINAGEFTLHQVNADVRVLMDINSLTTTTAEKGADFKSNQTIRVIDQIGNDIAVLFNTKYLGTIQNNEAGRIGLWNDIVKHHRTLANLGAIENFKDSDVVVTAGDSKRAVVVSDAVTIVNAMEQLYMTVTIQ